MNVAMRNLVRLTIITLIVVAIIVGIIWWIIATRNDVLGLRSERNLGRISIAMDTYYKTHQSYPPPAIRGREGKRLLSWRVLLLPFLGQKDLYAEFDLNERWDSGHNKRLLHKMPDVFKMPCKGAPVGHTHYQVITGLHTAFGPKKLSKNEFSRGYSKTIFIVEAQTSVPWTKPSDLSYSPDQPLPLFFGESSDKSQISFSRFFDRRKFHVAFGGGATRWFDWDNHERELRKLIER